MKRRVLVPLIALALGACSATTPAIHFYSLSQGSSSHVNNSVVPQRELQLAPLTLSDQIDSVNLVYELPGHELQLAEQNRWAGTLDNQLEQLTLEGLSARLPGWVIREEGGKGPRLSLRVQQFAGRYDGKALVTVRWRLIGEDGKVLLDKLFQSERPLPTDGYNALVGELASSWSALLDDVAKGVSATH